MSSTAAQNATLSPSISPASPRVRRQPSSRRRAGSQLPPVQTAETHEAALKTIRAHLRSRTNYDSFPISFRVIVLDTKLEVRKALQCFLYNGGSRNRNLGVPEPCLIESVSCDLAGVVSAPLWNSEKSSFAGMLTVSDIIHLIQYYYHTATYESAAADVENLRLENLRRASPFLFGPCIRHLTPS